MKKLKLLLLINILFLFNIIEVKAARNPYPKDSQYGPYKTQCTYFAWQQVYDKTGVALPGWGNANTWFDNAKKAGYEVGTTPKAKSIVVWKWDNYGHVGYVEKVSNGKIYVWDSDSKCTDQEDPDYKACLEKSPSQNGDEECLRKYGKTIACEYDATYWSVPGDLIGYIYLDKIPTTKPVTTTPTPAKKSNNNYLKTLTISYLPFEFNKNTLKYALTTNLDKIKIEGTPEDKKSTVEGLKEYNLNIGKNTINIIITAEDKAKKTYTLEIKRNDNTITLEEIKITNLNFTFNKDIKTYNIDAPSTLEEITIDAKASSDTATVTGVGTYKLNEGVNKFEIIVKAEDNSTNTYTLNINKKETEKKDEIKKEVKKENNNITIYIIIGITISIIAISLLILKKIIHHR